MDHSDTLPDLAGRPLDEALAILKERGVEPRIEYAMPEKMKKEDKPRTARVIRLKDNCLLCSCFLDSRPETAK